MSEVFIWVLNGYVNVAFGTDLGSIPMMAMGCRWSLEWHLGRGGCASAGLVPGEVRALSLAVLVVSVLKISLV